METCKGRKLSWALWWLTSQLSTLAEWTCDWQLPSGWFDALLQNKAYVDFATDAPGYGPLQNASVIKQLNADFYKEGGCQDQDRACYAAGNSISSNKICQTAAYCVSDSEDGYCSAKHCCFSLNRFLLLRSVTVIRTICARILRHYFPQNTIFITSLFLLY